MKTREELEGMKKDELVDLVMEMQESRKRGPRIKNQKYVAKDGDASKLPRQAKILYDLLKEEGELTEVEMKEKVSEHADDLKTKQDPWRIFSYYRPRLISDGLINVVPMEDEKAS